MYQIFKKSFKETVIFDEFGLRGKLIKLITNDIHREVYKNIGDKLQDKLSR